jgi:hypothetical protein
VPTGDPTSVATRLRAYAAAGADHIVCALACPDDARTAMIELLAGEVRPTSRRQVKVSTDEHPTPGLEILPRTRGIVGVSCHVRTARHR